MNAPQGSAEPVRASSDPHHLLRAVASFQQAWIDADPSEVKTHLADCWTATSSYTNPIVAPVTGVDGVTNLILDYAVLFPDAILRPLSDVSLHHMHAFYRWSLTSSAPIRLLGRKYGHVLTGHDHLEFDTATGKISSVVAFYDQPVVAQPPTSRLTSGPPPVGPPPAPASAHTLLDLVDHLGERLDTEEAALRERFALAPWRWNRAPDDPLDSGHLLAEVSAKRRVLTLHRPLRPTDHEPRCRVCADPALPEVRAPWPCATLLAVAQSYAPTPAQPPTS